MTRPPPRSTLFPYPTLFRSIRWGKMPPRSQYALFILAVTFTWLMGLMGFARSGIRQYWHVWQVMQDTSRYAATPALGYASQMIDRKSTRLNSSHSQNSYAVF